MADEKQPLIGGQSQRNVPDAGLGHGSSAQPTAPTEAYDSIRTDVTPNELPPPYTAVAASGGGVPMVTCKVCQSMIDISKKRTQHVAKCDNCNEATPIKNPPVGKKYVRCRCNCLLICKDSSQRIACPRADCRRIINLSIGPRTISPGMCRATCGHCHDTFIFNTLSKALARCPQCRRVSSVGNFARRRGYIYFTCAIVALLIGIIATVCSYSAAKYHHGIYIVFVGCFVSSILLLIRAIYYFTMKISFIDNQI